MSSITKHYCDKCKKETPQNELLNVKIEISAQSYSYADKRTQFVSKDVCPNCAVKVGFIRQEVRENKVANVIKTTPEQLYDLISQIVWENTQQQS